MGCLTPEKVQTGEKIMLKNAYANPLSSGIWFLCIRSRNGVMCRREEPIPAVFFLNYVHEDKALSMGLLYLKQTHFFCTKHVRLVRFNLLLTFTLGFSPLIILLYLQLTGFLVSFWQE